MQCHIDRMGVDTGSCAPATRKQYCYSAAKEFMLRLIIW